MKILMVVASYSLAFGGPTAVVKALSKELVLRGHEVCIYTSDNFNETTRVRETGNTIEIDGVKVSYFRNIHNRLAYNHNIYVSPMLIHKARRDLKEYDIIHIHGYRTFQSIIIHHYAKKYGIPYILQAHGSVLPFLQKQNLKKIFDLTFGYKILKNATKLIALTKTEAEQYKKMGVNDDNIIVVPNGIDVSEYADLQERGDFRKKYSIRSDEKVVLYIGRLHRSKGIDLLIEAFMGISNELNNVKLVIVGPDDGYLSVLKMSVQELKLDENVIFAGFVSSNEIKAAFIDADVFVTPSYSGFPVTFLEACACGTPIITTNKGDELDWIQNKVGYVVEYDKKHLQEAIVSILGDEELRRKFSREGQKLVEENFLWNKIAKVVERSYSEAISGRAF